MKKKVADITQVIYFDKTYSESRICNPTDEEIKQCVLNKEFEERSFQGDLKELKDEWNNNADYDTYCCRQRIYHARRIAYFVHFGGIGVITLYNDGKTVLDGGHRLRAAKFNGLSEVDFIMLDSLPMS